MADKTYYVNADLHDAMQRRANSGTGYDSTSTYVRIAADTVDNDAKVVGLIFDLSGQAAGSIPDGATITKAEIHAINIDSKSADDVRAWVHVLDEIAVDAWVTTFSYTGNENDTPYQRMVLGDLANSPCATKWSENNTTAGGEVSYTHTDLKGLIQDLVDAHSGSAVASVTVVVEGTAEAGDDGKAMDWATREHTTYSAPWLVLDWSTSQSATAAPALVTAVAAVPAPSVAAGAVAAPSITAVTAAVPSPAPSGGAGTTTVAVAAPVAVLAPSISTDTAATAAPAAVTAIAAIPSLSIQVGQSASASVVSASSAVPMPAADGGANPAPAVVAATTTVPAPSVTQSQSAAPAVVAATTTVPAPSVTTGVLTGVIYGRSWCYGNLTSNNSMWGVVGGTGTPYFALYSVGDSYSELSAGSGDDGANGQPQAGRGYTTRGLWRDRLIGRGIVPTFTREFAVSGSQAGQWAIRANAELLAQLEAETAPRILVVMTLGANDFATYGRHYDLTDQAGWAPAVGQIADDIRAVIDDILGAVAANPATPTTEILLNSYVNFPIGDYFLFLPCKSALWDAIFSASATGDVTETNVNSLAQDMLQPAYDAIGTDYAEVTVTDLWQSLPLEGSPPYAGSDYDLFWDCLHPIRSGAETWIDAALDVWLPSSAIVASPSTLTIITEVTPALVTAVAAVPAPSVAAGAVAAPANASAVAAIPSATVTAASTATPAAVAATTTIPAPVVSISGDATATPAVVAATTTVPAPSVTQSQSAAPAVVAATTTVPAPSVTTGAVAAPALVTAVAAVPAPSATANSSYAAGAVAAAVAIPSSVITAGATATATPVMATAAIPSPTVQAGGDITVGPDGVGGVAAIPAPVVSASVTITPTAIICTATVAAATVAGSAQAAPVTVMASVSIPAPAVSAGANYTSIELRRVYDLRTGWRSPALRSEWTLSGWRSE